MDARPVRRSACPATCEECSCRPETAHPPGGGPFGLSDGGLPRHAPRFPPCRGGDLTARAGLCSLRMCEH
ncbi:hypothetical protein TOK_2825 [Pseudonocardia sp. N23]|nr:hypothetical protein TOK_2825 [Pseudonocardia sp. N23]